jgi:seryl-tRNA synthetase
VIDIRELRENFEEVAGAIARKNPELRLEEILALDQSKRSLQRHVETLRSKQKSIGKEIAGASGEKRQALMAEAKILADELSGLETRLEEEASRLRSLLDKVPNPPHPSVPDGRSEEDNEVVRMVGEPRRFDFPVRDQETLGESLDVIDLKRGAKTSGSRFVYLKRQAVLLELALVEFAMKKAVKYGFVPVIPPVLVREQAMYGTGFFPADEFEFYHVPEDGLFLAGTSEVPLASLHSGEILEASELPIRYAGFSSCFRREAGTYGKDTRGAFRVHQFDKVELFSFTRAEASWDEHEYLLSIEEELVSELGLPYRVVNVCAGELGASAAKKYDIEVWLPSEGRYREATSCSNCTDFQSRRLGIRYRSDDRTSFCHTLNGTAVACTRWIVFILENFQEPDGSVTIPEPLRDYVASDRISPL